MGPTTPCICCHTPCETLMSENKRLTINYKVVWGCYISKVRWVVNNQIKKGLLLSLSVKKILIGEYLAKLQARTWLSRALCAPCHQNHVTLPNIHLFVARINYVLCMGKYLWSVIATPPPTGSHVHRKSGSIKEMTRWYYTSLIGSIIRPIDSCHFQ